MNGNKLRATRYRTAIAECKRINTVTRRVLQRRETIFKQAKNFMVVEVRDQRGLPVAGVEVIPSLKTYNGPVYLCYAEMFGPNAGVRGYFTDTDGHATFKSPARGKITLEIPRAPLRNSKRVVLPNGFPNCKKQTGLWDGAVYEVAAQKGIHVVKLKVVTATNREIKRNDMKEE